MARKQITVQTHHTYIERVDELARQLKEAGMIVQEEIKGLGHFRGTAEAGNIETLKKLPGVASVKVIGEEGEQEPDDYSIS
jgi:uncharacterized protein YnzC (UPF0291/DUF896 family)